MFEGVGTVLRFPQHPVWKNSRGLRSLGTL